MHKGVLLMMERRKYNRVKTPLPVRLRVINDGKTKVLDLVTKDLSYTGAFIPTLTSFPEGTRFKLDFTLPTDNLKAFKYIESLKSCAGKVVRSTPHGFAIRFDEDCQIESLKAL